MVAAGDSGRNFAQRLGIHHDQIVQELGWDDDTDDDIRAQVEEACGSDLLDEDADEVVDVVLMWWRDEDGWEPKITAERRGEYRWKYDSDEDPNQWEGDK